LISRAPIAVARDRQSKQEKSIMKSIRDRIWRQRPRTDYDAMRSLHQFAEDEFDEVGRRMREGVTMPIKPTTALVEIKKVLGSQGFFRWAPLPSD
jgi:hypothetical protein